MGLTAIVSSSASSASSAAGVSATVTSLLSPVGLGVGGVFVAAALIAMLVYLDLLDASETASAEVRRTVVVVVIPLAFAFAAVVAFKTQALL